MTTNLHERDLLELRRLANPESQYPSTDIESLPPDSYTETELLRARQREELALLETSADTIERPYLHGLPNTYPTEVTAFEWLDYLVNRAGFKATSEALSYYVTVGWIDEAAREELRAYLRGFSQVESLDPDGPGPHSLGIDDHVLSLIYIARLAAQA